MHNERIKNILDESFKVGQEAKVSFTITAEDVLDLLTHIYELGRADEQERRCSEDAEIFLTKKEAMRLLGKSESTLWKWEKSGFLVSIRRGGSITYKKSDVDKIIRGNKQ